MYALFIHASLIAAAAVASCYAVALIYLKKRKNCKIWGWFSYITTSFGFHLWPPFDKIPLLKICPSLSISHDYTKPIKLCRSVISLKLLHQVISLSIFFVYVGWGILFAGMLSLDSTFFKYSAWFVKAPRTCWKIAVGTVEDSNQIKHMKVLYWYIFYLLTVITVEKQINYSNVLYTKVHATNMVSLNVPVGLLKAF